MEKIVEFIKDVKDCTDEELESFAREHKLKKYELHKLISLVDIELEKAIELIKKYGEIKIKKAYEIAKDMYKAKEGEYNQVLTNAHISKGLEWHKVIIYDDFPSLEEEYEKLCKQIDELPNDKDDDKDEIILALKNTINEKRTQKELNALKEDVLEGYSEEFRKRIEFLISLRIATLFLEQKKEAFRGEVNLYYVALTRAKDEIEDYTDNHREYIKSKE